MSTGIVSYGYNIENITNKILFCNAKMKSLLTFTAFDHSKGRCLLRMPSRILAPTPHHLHNVNNHSCCILRVNVTQ